MRPEDLMAMQQQKRQAGTPDPTMGEQSQVDPSSQPAQPQQPPIPPDGMMGSQPNQGFLPPHLDPVQNQEGDMLMNNTPDAPDPVDALPMVILDYLDFATETRQDKALAAPVRSQVMLQIAQAINYLVPLLPKTDPNAEQDFQLKVAEFQMKQQEQELAIQLKQQEHQMDMAMKQQELQFKQAENQMKLQQAQQAHQQKLVQNEQLNQQKVEQAKQAAQAKPTQNPTNKPSNGGAK